LTGVHCVQRVITNLAMFDVVPGGLKLAELAPGVTREQVAASTEATLV
jgi:3-oxoacid CoA-transferase subunit B